MSSMWHSQLHFGRGDVLLDLKLCKTCWHTGALYLLVAEAAFLNQTKSFMLRARAKLW